MKKLLISAIAFGALTAVVSCEKEKIVTYDGPDAVEFYPVSKTVYTPTFAYPDSAKIQFVAKQRTSDAKVTYAVDTATTAVAATDYQITGTAGETAVPANNSFAYIKYNLLPVTASKKLVFTLTGGDNIKASENYKKYTLTISPTPVIFTPNTKAITFAGGTSVIRDTVRIRLNNAAARFNQPVTLNYTVKTGTTAVEGVDYAFVSTKGVSTVPANSADALVILDINPVAAQKTLILDVTSVAGISLAGTTRIVTYTIKP